jgi:hypothetical protein
MPENKNRQTVPPGADGGTGQKHPVLEDVAEAARMVSDAAGYLSPTREFDVPHLEEGDWPPDLNPAETLAMLRQLAGITHAISGCLGGITCQHAVPDAAKPELERIADLLTHAGSQLSGLAGSPAQDTRAAGSPLDTRQDFPHPPVTGPLSSAHQATPVSPSPPRHPMTP